MSCRAQRHAPLWLPEPYALRVPPYVCCVVPSVVARAAVGTVVGGIGPWHSGLQSASSAYRFTGGWVGFLCGWLCGPSPLRTIAGSQEGNSLFCTVFWLPAAWG